MAEIIRNDNSIKIFVIYINQTKPNQIKRTQYNPFRAGSEKGKMYEVLSLP